MARIARRRQCQQGFTLVEFMIASAIALVIASALVTVFVDSMRARTELDRSNQQIENGRYALELLSDELRVAGYYGELPIGTALQTTAPACALTAAQLGWQVSPLRVPVPVEAIAPAAVGAACLADRAAALPAIAIRRVATEAVAPAAIVAPNEYLQTSRCDADPPTTPLVISGNAAAFTLRNLTCGAPTAVRRILQRTYYVASCSNCGADTIPSLKRVELVDGTLQLRTLVEGIEAIGLDYGFDVDGDGAPDAWRTGVDGIVGSPTNDWGNVMAVRLHVLSRSLQATAGYVDSRVYDLGLLGTLGPFGDGFKRRVYSGVIRLNNPSGRREA